jgi:hypothetical protein
MVCLDDKLEVVRMAPKRPAPGLPFGVWMALVKATPVPGLHLGAEGDRDQASLVECQTLVKPLLP